ncbi:Hypothetical protein, putative, partial [Bodo saltans]
GQIVWDEPKRFSRRRSRNSSKSKWKTPSRNRVRSYWTCYAAKKDADREEFEVRLCLDELGGSPELIRACCAVGNDALRGEKGLNWHPRVQIRLFATGTGIGTVQNPVGSEYKFYKLVTLATQHEDNSAKLYWKLRDTYFASKDEDKVPDLQNLVKRLGTVWDDPVAGPSQLRQRDEYLTKHKHKVFGNLVWVREALFSAVDADAMCRCVLTNAKLATLVFARCHDLAKDIAANSLCRYPTV